jgi:D-amino peptidase
VVVHDTHAWGVNLAAELLPAGIELKRCHAVGPVPILGTVPEGCLVFMVAVHVGAGKPGHLPHTFRTRFRRVTVDGRDVGESELYAALLDRVGARVALVTGDRSATDEVREVLPWCLTVPVPRTGDGSGVLPAIREAAADASAHAERARCFCYPGPVEMAFQFESPVEAQRHRMAPWASDGDWLRHRGPFEEVFRAFLDMAYLGRWAPLRSLAVPLVGLVSRWRFG